MNTIEMTCQDDHLIIVRGPVKTIDDLLKIPAANNNLSCLEIAKREFSELRPSETLVGAGRLAPISTLRAMAAVLPGISDNLAQLPLPGDDLNWRALKEGASLTWQISLPSNELMALSSLRSLNTEVLHELMSQFVLEQFNKAATKTSQQEFIKEQMRRIRNPDPEK